jgi:hypothetical protein
MKLFVVWLIGCWLISLLVIMSIAEAAPTIERSIDNRTILLNSLKCDTGGYKAFQIENNVVQSGCWRNDGKYVNITIDGKVTQYNKQLFELAVIQPTY